MSKKNKLILGCGNLLLQDEGIGVHLIEYIRQKPLPADVELLDGGTAGFDLIDFIMHADKVVIVDAVKAGGRPGEIYCFGPDDFKTDPSPKTSLHGVGLNDVFRIIQQIDSLPEIRIIGIEPQNVDFGTELSDRLKQLLPKISELVLKEIEGN